MKQAHYDKLREAINERVDLKPELYKSYIKQGFPMFQYIRDLIWSLSNQMIKFIEEELYTYLDDEELKQAVRKILKERGISW